MEPYVFQPSEEPVQFCVLQRPHGTVIEVTMDWMPPTYWKGHQVRKHHIELHGGHCTGDTGFLSHFSYQLQYVDQEPELVAYALRIAEMQFKELHPKGQFDLFEQPTT